MWSKLRTKSHGGRCPWLGNCSGAHSTKHKQALTVKSPPFSGHRRIICKSTLCFCSFFLSFCFRRLSSFSPRKFSSSSRNQGLFMAQLPPKPRTSAVRPSTDLPLHPYERDDKMEPGEWERDRDRDRGGGRPIYRDDPPPRDYPPSSHREHERDRRDSYPPPSDSYVTGLGRERGARDGERPREDWDRFRDSRDRDRPDPYFRDRDKRPPPFEGRPRDSYHDHSDPRRRDGRFPVDTYRGTAPPRPPPGTYLRLKMQ